VPSPIRLFATPTATPERELSLTNAVSELDAGDRDRSIRKRLEPCHRCAPPLDRAVVLLDEIIEILVRAHPDVAPAQVLSPQQPQGATTRHMAVERHLSWDARKRRCERLSKERLCCCDATVTTKQEVNGLVVLVDGAV
jgi:hypothetical protein